MTQREIVQIPELPPANPSYSQAVKVGEVVYVAGQIGTDPKTGKLISNNMADQTRQALANLDVILRAAGSAIEKTAKTTIYIVDMNQWESMNKVYVSYFPQNPPAKTTVEVGKLALGALVEIEAIAAT